VILGTRLHERLGDEGAFCGPALHHDLRDLQADNDHLRDLTERAAAFLIREADSITKYPFELHENAQRFRIMAAELSSEPPGAPHA
jgi:hypothetical protein